MREVLSLGAGVQSSTVLLMSLQGELPKLDYCIFADTGWEPPRVYEWLMFLKRKMAEAGVTFLQVNQGDIREDALISQLRGTPKQGARWASMPCFTLGSSGERGMIRRQCTYEYKIRPIEMALRRQVMGLVPRQRAPVEPVIRQWLGISFDERMRMRLPDHKWKTHYYPLVEMRKTRLWCLDWMERNGYPDPPRSACIGCPYHNNSEWREMKIKRPDEFEDACSFDDAIRDCGGLRGQVFLHAERIPLRDVDFRDDFDRGQLPLFDGFANECEGMCGI